ncbi:Uncharacterised protein [Metamycoplasma cloacale]|uniref:Uncharacterized protein n=1 Tax=Metamycoplasma cloacale TaxID=92401 RepID=A0A2Z4LMG5_9BACT|nr:hypothetical protein [Metamycoplasma cloacale]AWX42926.1 hypothetical protein DK849_02555 [Metamycoplasma cloacale]VEU79250.1 Uncharacterised protein [Metamycoplasma cloacale]
MNKKKKMTIVLCSTLIPIVLSATIATAVIVSKQERLEPGPWHNRWIYEKFEKDPKTFINYDKSSLVKHPFIRLTFNNKITKIEQLKTFVKEMYKPGYILLSTFGLDKNKHDNSIDVDDFIEEQLKESNYINLLYVPLSFFADSIAKWKKALDLDLSEYIYLNSQDINKDSLFYNFAENGYSLLFPTYNTLNSDESIIEKLMTPGFYHHELPCFEFNLGNLSLIKNTNLKECTFFIYQRTYWYDQTIKLGFAIHYINDKGNYEWGWIEIPIFKFEY